MSAFHSHHLLHESNNIVQSSNNVIDDDAPEEVEWWKDAPIIKYKGFWNRPDWVRGCQVMEEQYNPLPTDIILASFPKTGTTWLKALTFSIINIHKISNLRSVTSSDQLSTHNPHELVPFLETETFGESPIIDINQIPSPRVFSTHIPYSILPDRIKKCGCKIVYISRNPWDAFVSLWHFFNMNYGFRTTIQVASGDFCKGLIPCGPYFEHVLEFWQVRNKDNVFFVTYEDLKDVPHKHVKDLAEFMNFPLNNDQVHKVVATCSFERLKKVEDNRDENRTKTHSCGVKFDTFYRKGLVGDWKNYLPQEIARMILEIGKQKWDGTGLEFKLLSNDTWGQF